MKARIRETLLMLGGAVAGIALSLQFAAIADKTTEPMEPGPLPIDDMRTLAEIFGKIKSDYVEPVEDRKLITEAINGMLSGLDPHSAYLDAEAYKDLKVGTQGQFGGLGIEVGMEDGFVKVVSPIEDTPAYRAGLKAGDLIIRIDDTPVKGMSLADAVKRMRGKPGTSIRLTILRKGEAKPVVVDITRAVIKIKSVKYQLAEPGYGYIRVTQFQEQTGENVASAITALYKENKAPLKGLVLDLRNDPGGLLNAAVGVAAAFLQPGDLVVYTEGRRPDSRVDLAATPEFYLSSSREKDYLTDLPDGVRSVPMVVLVNGGSASASEIVAGALQDHGRAIVMGTETFGKGSVQTVLPIGPDTAIKLTTARYYTPDGRSIQATGIVPDIIVEEARLDSSEETASRVREADLAGHLENGNGKSKKDAGNGDAARSPAPTSGTEGEPKDAVDDDSTPRLIRPDDYQLNQALNLLKGLQIYDKRQQQNRE